MHLPHNDNGLSSGYLARLGARIPQAFLESRQKEQLSACYRSQLDRINVLEGHTGCVNAISWAEDGDLLLTGGDDTTVRLWRTDPADTEQEYPYKSVGVLETGHRGNIFNAHMLPQSNRIATVSGDGQVRVFDVGSATSTTTVDGYVRYRRQDASIAVLRCHTSRTKRIVTEDSPDHFLSVAEDGRVRQHDLRTPHTCRHSCPPPIVKVSHELSTISLSTLVPHQFVVAGDSPFGYLFDRRQAGRFVKEEYGEVPNTSQSDLALCVRRFGRTPILQERRSTAHITGAKMSSYNGHEVLLSYSGDGVYLFSTRDSDIEPDQISPSKSSSPKPTKSKRSREVNSASSSPRIDPVEFLMDLRRAEVMDDDLELAGSNHSGSDSDHRSSEAESDEEEEEEDLEADEADLYNSEKYRSSVPVIHPRARFAGACNVETVKDVNFIGPYDELVVSGSDDGNFFVWDKLNPDQPCGIYEGDGSVVNVIEAHPYLPLVAVSGIDTTVKLFSPVRGESQFSKLSDVEAIMKANQNRSRGRSSAYVVSDILLRQFLRQAVRAEGEAEEEGSARPQCEYQ